MSLYTPTSVTKLLTIFSITKGQYCEVWSYNTNSAHVNFLLPFFVLHVLHYITTLLDTLLKMQWDFTSQSLLGVKGLIITAE